MDMIHVIPSSYGNGCDDGRIDGFREERDADIAACDGATAQARDGAYREDEPSVAYTEAECIKGRRGRLSVSGAMRRAWLLTGDAVVVGAFTSGFCLAGAETQSIAVGVAAKVIGLLLIAGAGMCAKRLHPEI